MTGDAQRELALVRGSSEYQERILPDADCRYRGWAPTEEQPEDDLLVDMWEPVRRLCGVGS